ncbi:hypothetical protein SRHO_G00029580 [Serrasalmus rhombeus]
MPGNLRQTQAQTCVSSGGRGPGSTGPTWREAAAGLGSRVCGAFRKPGFFLYSSSALALWPLTSTSSAGAGMCQPVCGREMGGKLQQKE